jgi:hypothetical protein
MLTNEVMTCGVEWTDHVVLGPIQHICDCVVRESLPGGTYLSCSNKERNWFRVAANTRNRHCQSASLVKKGIAARTKDWRPVVATRQSLLLLTTASATMYYY